MFQWIWLNFHNSWSIEDVFYFTERNLQKRIFLLCNKSKFEIFSSSCIFISAIAYHQFLTFHFLAIFPSISYSALFAIFRESNPRCLCSTQSICSDPPKAHITIGFSISSAICTQIYFCLLFPISKF